MSDYDRFYDELNGGPPAVKKTYDMLPEGQYLCKIRKCVYFKEVEPNMVQWEFEIVEGDYTKRRIWETRTTDADSNRFTYTLADFKAVDIIPKNKEELVSACTKAANLGHYVILENKHNVSNKNGKTYANAKIIKKGDPIPQQQATGQDVVDTDLIPF